MYSACPTARYLVPKLVPGFCTWASDRPVVRMMVQQHIPPNLPNLDNGEERPDSSSTSRQMQQSLEQRENKKKNEEAKLKTKESLNVTCTNMQGCNCIA